ncbi:unnamed protein product [Moneuplotes crassus]|uniref:Uncharacterized protein n=1 Tax=Euplotes crassus TaxID=5936 RepID=A0AAD2CXA3_EUPCR|nr:unnamed protein product [Moneuplotes crassus]
MEQTHEALTEEVKHVEVELHEELQKYAEDEDIATIEKSLLQIFSNPDNLVENGYSKEVCEMIYNSIEHPNHPNLALLESEEEEKTQEWYFKGYFSRNFIKQLSLIMQMWKEQAKFPIKFWKLEGFSEENQNDIMNTRTEGLLEIYKDIKEKDEESLTKMVEDWLIEIKPRGMWTMLGLRTTTGSQDHLTLPSRGSLLDSFNALNTPPEKSKSKKIKKPSILTVGAKALSKHGHRGKEGYWGSITGKESAKNERANEKALMILDDCVWINMHVLPHKEYILEMRVQECYGIRWTDTPTFRGLLEPQMKDGHEKGWKH